MCSGGQQEKRRSRVLEIFSGPLEGNLPNVTAILTTGIIKSQSSNELLAEHSQIICILLTGGGVVVMWAPNRALLVSTGRISGRRPYTFTFQVHAII